MKKDILKIAGTDFNSRLILGTGKFRSISEMKLSVEASQTDMVTVALRRVDLNRPEDNLLYSLDSKKIIMLPNTSGAQNADEAVRLARIAKATGLTDWIKLEITPEPKYLLPCGTETLKASKILVKEGFKVMPYIQPDPILAKNLEEVGTASVMPLGSLIGSNQGLKSLDMLKIIISESNIPVVVDAGIGKPSDAVLAMEIGADAVLVNTAIATASNPEIMAKCFKNAVKIGRDAYISGLASNDTFAHASSSLEWISTLQ